MKPSVLLDTSFFIRLLNSSDPLHSNALGYYKYYLEQGVRLKISTISIAEYCVIGNISDLPLKNLQILPFNQSDAQRTGEFAKILFEHNRIEVDKLMPRAIIPNDSKLFAQSDKDSSVTHFVTSDARSMKNWNALKKKTTQSLKFLTLLLHIIKLSGF